MKLYEKALSVSVKAHKDQVRKHDGSPYVTHPIMVANILMQHNFNEIIIAAALVHDVLEDAEINENQLRQELGDEVVNIVTLVSEDKDLVWEERKEKYVLDVSSSNEAVWAVSVADKIHNARSLIEHYRVVGPDVWKVFNRGKEKKVWFERLLLNSLQEKWIHPLMTEYAELVGGLDNLES